MKKNNFKSNIDEVNASNLDAETKEIFNALDNELKNFFDNQPIQTQIKTDTELLIEELLNIVFDNWLTETTKHIQNDKQMFAELQKWIEHYNKKISTMTSLQIKLGNDNLILC